MDAIWAIFIFLAISIIADQIEGQKKKKRRQKTGAPRPEEPAGGASVPPVPDLPDLPDMPEDRDAGFEWNDEMQPELPPAALPRPEPEPEKKPRPALQPSAAQPEPRKARPKEVDIHRETILSAITYAQILDPPRAYRYMTRRRR